MDRELTGPKGKLPTIILLMGIVSDCPLNLHLSKYRLEQLSDLTREVSLCCGHQLTEKLTTVSKRVSVECSVANLSPLHPPSQGPHRRGDGKTASHR